MKEHIYRNPKKYSENNSLQYNFAIDMLSNIVFESSSRVLDIGCGDGVNSGAKPRIDGAGLS